MIVHRHPRYMGNSVFDKVIWHTIGPENFYLAQKSFLFGPVAQLIMIYIVTNSINWLKMYSQWHTHKPLLSQFGPCFKSYQKLCWEIKRFISICANLNPDHNTFTKWLKTNYLILILLYR